MSEAKRGPRVKQWCLTIYDALPPTYDEKTMEYLEYQQEKAPSTGRLHWQTYVGFKKQRRRTEMQALLKLQANPHAEATRGKPKEAGGYCGKPETAVADTHKIFGVLPTEHQFKTDTISEMVKDLQKGASNKELFEKHPKQYFLHKRKIDEIREDMYDDQTDRDAPKVYVCIGESGSGKTAWAKAQGNFYLVSSISGNGGEGWFNGYRGQPVMIFDNIGHNWKINYDFLLRVLDRNPVNLPTKGGFVYMKPTTTTIVLTSIHSIDRWFGEYDKEKNWIGRDLSELNRRITETLEFNMGIFPETHISGKGVWNILDKRYIQWNDIE